MRRMPTLLLAVSLTCLAVTATGSPQTVPAKAAGPTAQAAPQADTAAKTPLAVLEDCIAAVSDGDFERYTQHLTSEELRVQAGTVLFLSATTTQLADLSPNTDPEMFLLSRSIAGIVARHQLSTGGQTSKQKQGADAIPELLQQVTGNLIMQVAGNDSFPGWTAPGRNMMREKLHQSADTLDDPRAFLADVLTEFNRPTKISGVRPEKFESQTGFAAVLPAFEKVKWTVYTRGDFAVAVDSAQKPNTSTPGGSGLHVEFQRINGRWLISQLYPVQEMMPTATGNCDPVCLPPAQSVPAAMPTPAVSPYAPAPLPSGPAYTPGAVPDLSPPYPSGAPVTYR